MRKLKTCPFCGGRTYKTSSKNLVSLGDRDGEGIRAVTGYKTKYGAACWECKIEMFGYNIEAEAIIAWNIRITDLFVDKHVGLLKRAKETFEPFPIVSDLRSMTQMLREKNTETDTILIKKAFKKREDKFRKVYTDINEALAEFKEINK